jgi:hypothetical protein
MKPEIVGQYAVTSGHEQPSTKSGIRDLFLVGFLCIWPLHRSGCFLSRTELNDCLK